MDLKERFFGKGTPQPGGLPVANPLLTDPPTFQLLYPTALDIDSETLTRYLRDYHSELAEATAEVVKMPAPPALPEGVAGPPGILGLIGWGRHVVKVVGFDSPMPVAALDRAVQPSHYDPELKEAAYNHASHVLLYYAGYETDPLEQHVALAASAAALARFGALVTMNETAHTSIPCAGAASARGRRRRHAAIDANTAAAVLLRGLCEDRSRWRTRRLDADIRLPCLRAARSRRSRRGPRPWNGDVQPIRGNARLLARIRPVIRFWRHPSCG